ncbi:MAG: cytochrome c oxidase subunit [Fimbriimonadaceae bacterium]|jgi:cytochrome c oxidase subunit 4|nr:cytochrome c oxidase subunit [Fimbriimonadaceae bacterium]
MAGHGHTKYKPGEVAWGAEHHILPISTYAKTIVALFVLMILTIWASTWHLPNVMIFGHTIAHTFFNNIIALTIAVIKAALVVMFFMHVKYSTSLTRFWAIIGFIWVTLIFFILADYMTRPLDPTIGRPWMADPGSSLHKHRDDAMSEDVDPTLNVNVRPRQ